MNRRIYVMLASLIAILMLVNSTAAMAAPSPLPASVGVTITEETSPGGKLFFVINATNYREAVPTAAELVVFLDRNGLAPISDDAVPLISTGTWTNGLDPMYTGTINIVGKDYIFVSIDLPSDITYWNNVRDVTGVNYLDGNPIYIKITSDPSNSGLTGVLTYQFTMTNNTLIAVYDYTGGQNLSYTGFDASGYGGPTTSTTLSGTVSIYEGDGVTPFNLTEYPTATATITVQVTNGFETYTLATGSIDGTGVTSGLGSDVLRTGATTVSLNAATLSMTFNDNLGNISVTPTGSVTLGGVSFPFSIFSQDFTVSITAVTSTAHYEFNGTADNLTIIFDFANTKAEFMLTSNSYWIVNSGSTLVYMQYNTTTDTFDTTDVATMMSDYGYNVTLAWAIYKINNAADFAIFPSIEITATDGTVVQPACDTGATLNPGDTFDFVAHNLKAGDAVTHVTIYYFDGTTFTFWYATGGTVDATVGADGTVTGTAVPIPDHWYGGLSFYVGVETTSGKTWLEPQITVYPYVEFAPVQNDGGFDITDGTMAPGDYVLVIGHGFIYDNITVYVTPDGTTLTPAEMLMVDTNGDNTADTIVFWKNTTAGEFYVFVRLPATYTSTPSYFIVKGEDDPTRNQGCSGTFNIVTDGTDMKFFVYDYRGPVNLIYMDTANPVSGSYLILPSGLGPLYPYVAYTTITGALEEYQVEIVVEIIGVDTAATTVEVAIQNTTHTTNVYQVATINVADMTNGYFNGTLQMPEAPWGEYVIYATDGTRTRVAWTNGGANLTLNMHCIAAVKVLRDGAPDVYVTLGSTSVFTADSALISVIGYGFTPSETITIAIEGYATPAATGSTDTVGTFNITVSANDVLTIAGTGSGDFTMIIVEGGTPVSPCNGSEFAWSIEETPSLYIDVEVDDNVFVGEIITVAIKAKLIFSYTEVPIDSDAASSGLWDITNLTIWFIYGSGDKVMVYTTDDITPILENPFTGELVYYHTVDRAPENGRGLVVDAYMQASLFRGGKVTEAFDHDVSSVDQKLEGMLNNIIAYINGNATAILNAINGSTGDILLAINGSTTSILEALSDNATAILNALSNVNTTVLASINTAKGQILANLTALKDMVSEGFADVELYMQGNFSQVLYQIALVQTMLGAYGDAILNETYNTQEMVTGYGNAILATLSEVNGTLYAAIETGFGTVMTELDNIAELINNNTQILNATIVDGKIEILAAIDTALGNLTTLIETKASNICMKINETGMLILEGLFGANVSLPLNTSIAELLAQAQDAVIEAVNTNAVQIKAQLAENTTAIITAVNTNADLILSTIANSTDNLTGSINAVGQKVDDAKTTLGDQIDTAKADILSSIDALKNETMTELGNVNQSVTSAVNTAAQKNADATKTYNAINSVLTLVTLALVGYIAFRKLG